MGLVLGLGLGLGLILGLGLSLGLILGAGKGPLDDKKNSMVWGCVLD